MEDTQVLNAESKSAPLQAPEAIDDNAFLEAIQPSSEPKVDKNIYNTSTPVVAEKDHATTISNNINDAYKYNSAVDLSKEPVVTTSSTTKGNVTDQVTWTSHYGMEDQFKATEKSDYEWNRIAAERAQFTYDKEATQVLADYAKSMQEIKEAGAMAMDTYFAAAYTANQTADKMGWQGGQVTSQDAKTAFLKASTAANMYSKFELQEYGLESQLTVARLYANAEMEKLALDLYQDAVDQAVRQGELTGYYISAEAGEIMKQQKVAQEILNKPHSTDAEKARAQQVMSAGNAFFDKLGFSKDEHGHYIGVETLSRLEYLETVRANKENERLQQQANDIARQAAADANYWAGKNYELASKTDTTIEHQYQNYLTGAFEEHGRDATTGFGRFVRNNNGGYTRVDGISKEGNGNYYGTVNGTKVVIKPNAEGYFDIVKTITVGSHGFFSNGYQPKDIPGAGLATNSGYDVTVTDHVNKKTVTQTLWTAGGRYYIWDGVHNTYIQVNQNTRSYEIK